MDTEIMGDVWNLLFILEINLVWFGRSHQEEKYYAMTYSF